MSIPKELGHLSPETRLQQVAELLARGLVRLRDKNAHQNKESKDLLHPTCNGDAFDS